MFSASQVAIVACSGPGTVLDAGVQRCGSHSPCPCGAQVLSDRARFSAIQEKMLRIWVVQRGLLRDAGQRGVEQSANKAQTLARILLDLLLPAALPGCNCHSCSPGEQRGPRRGIHWATVTAGTSQSCGLLGFQRQIPSSLYSLSSAPPPPLPAPRAASRAQAPGWPETLLWEHVSSED